MPPDIVFAKGHGTHNDFVLLPDQDARLSLTEEQVRALCDRRAGIGADGVLRIVSASVAPDDAVDGAQWFMDHRNADGSLAEMCGNGIRLFVRYLLAHQLASGQDVAVATRGGVRNVRVLDDGRLEVAMGRASAPRAGVPVVVSVGDRQWPATGVLVPNPHAVVFVDDVADAGPLHNAPDVAPVNVFPNGVNVEFVVVESAEHIRMRVFERGVGETQSCGTGACAAAWATRRRLGATGSGRLRVDVPGGTLHVREDADGELYLAGPAQIVAEGRIDAAWWKARSLANPGCGDVRPWRG